MDKRTILQTNINISPAVVADVRKCELLPLKISLDRTEVPETAQSQRLHKISHWGWGGGGGGGGGIRKNGQQILIGTYFYPEDSITNTEPPLDRHMPVFTGKCFPSC